MALGKSTKKTPKPVSLPQSKAKVSTATKTEPISQEEQTPVTKTRRSAATVNVNGALPKERTKLNGTQSKAMAAVVGHPGLEKFAGQPYPSIGIVTPADLPGRQVSSRNGITRELIAQRAYFYWTQRNYAHGFAEEDWARAEMDLTGNN